MIRRVSDTFSNEQKIKYFFSKKEDKNTILADNFSELIRIKDHLDNNNKSINKIEKIIVFDKINYEFSGYSEIAVVLKLFFQKIIKWKILK